MKKLESKLAIAEREFHRAQYALGYALSREIAEHKQIGSVSEISKRQTLEAIAINDAAFRAMSDLDAERSRQLGYKIPKAFA